MGRTIDELGEFGVIADVIARLPQTTAVLVGPGDDAAVLALADPRVIVTTDMVIEHRHFRREWSSPYDVGRKAAARSISDVLAMGGRPTALVTAIALPSGTTQQWVTDLVDGMRDECTVVDACIVGGDFSRADVVMVTVTALGAFASGTQPITRAGARPGDVVVVAGNLGWAAAGLELLQHGVTQPSVLVEAHRHPSLPYDAAQALAQLAPNAMCDVSDGLVQDLGHIAEASNVQIEVGSTLLPIDPALVQAAAVLGHEPVTWALTGGDDYALVACLPAESAIPASCTQIGVVAAGTGVFVDGRPYVAPGGHDHFRQWAG